MDDGRSLEMALNRASSWFQIHADQRLKLFNFYVVFFLGLLAGYATTFKDGAYYLAAVVSFLSLIITFAFKQLDCRSGQLVKHAECALKVIEERIDNAIHIDEINLVRRANGERGFWSYRKVFNLIFIVSAIVSILGFVMSLCRAYGS